jgi:hypothetical protein
MKIFPLKDAPNTGSVTQLRRYPVSVRTSSSSSSSSAIRPLWWKPHDPLDPTLYPCSVPWQNLAPELLTLFQFDPHPDQGNSRHASPVLSSSDSVRSSSSSPYMQPQFAAQAAASSTQRRLDFNSESPVATPRRSPRGLASSQRLDLTMSPLGYPRPPPRTLAHQQQQHRASNSLVPMPQVYLRSPPRRGPS